MNIKKKENILGIWVYTFRKGFRITRNKLGFPDEKCFKIWNSEDQQHDSVKRKFHIRPHCNQNRDQTGQKLEVVG